MRADALLLHRRFEPCTNVTAEVYLRAYLSPCINDCGIYGQCKLLRTNNYLYAACECKAGESCPGHPWCLLHPGTPPGILPSSPGVVHPISSPVPALRRALERGFPAPSPAPESAAGVTAALPGHRLERLGLHRQCRGFLLWLPAPLHAAALPQQCHVCASRGHRRPQPLPPGSCRLHLHHVLLHCECGVGVAGGGRRGAGAVWGGSHTLSPHPSFTTPATSQASWCSASWSTTCCSSATSWAPSCLSGSPSLPWPGSSPWSSRQVQGWAARGGHGGDPS